MKPHVEAENKEKKMARIISEATQLRTVKAELARTKKELASTITFYKTYKTNAVKAEQELCEWKSRFDLLLRLSEK